MTMMEMLKENQMGLPYGCLVTRICQRFVTDIPAYEPEASPEGAFGKHTAMKSNAQLQRYMYPEEAVHLAPQAQPKPSAASSSQVTPPSDAVMSAIERITSQLQSMDAQ
jgi:hypothetical protein